MPATQCAVEHAKTCPDVKVKVAQLFVNLVGHNHLRYHRHGHRLGKACPDLRLRLGTPPADADQADQNVTKTHTNTPVDHHHHHCRYFAPQCHDQNITQPHPTYLQIRLHTRIQFGRGALKVIAIAGALPAKNAAGLLLMMTLGVKIRV